MIIIPKYIIYNQPQTLNTQYRLWPPDGDNKHLWRTKGGSRCALESSLRLLVNSRVVSSKTSSNELYLYAGKDSISISHHAQMN